MKKSHNGRKKCLRKWLKKNKIFFEIISSVCLSLMSMVTFAVSISFNQGSSEIYEKQLEILENDREPYFTIFFCFEVDVKV